jgi:hypothetical protein
LYQVCQAMLITVLTMIAKNNSMHLEIFQWWMLAGGSVFAVFGGLIVFSDKFFNWIESTWWRNTPADEKLFPGRSGYIFDRYGRGLGALTLGVLMLAGLLGSVWKPILPILTVIVTPTLWLSTDYGRIFAVICVLIGVFVLVRKSYSK